MKPVAMNVYWAENLYIVQEYYVVGMCKAYLWTLDSDYCPLIILCKNENFMNAVVSVLCECFWNILFSGFHCSAQINLALISKSSLAL